MNQELLNINIRIVLQSLYRNIIIYNFFETSTETQQMTATVCARKISLYI